MSKLYWLIGIVIVIALVYFFFPNVISEAINFVENSINSIVYVFPQY